MKRHISHHASQTLLEGCHWENRLGPVCTTWILVRLRHSQIQQHNCKGNWGGGGPLRDCVCTEPRHLLFTTAHRSLLATCQLGLLQSLHKGLSLQLDHLGHKVINYGPLYTNPFWQLDHVWTCHTFTWTSLGNLTICAPRTIQQNPLGNPTTSVQRASTHRSPSVTWPLSYRGHKYMSFFYLSPVHQGHCPFWQLDH